MHKQAAFSRHKPRVEGCSSESDRPGRPALLTESSWARSSFRASGAGFKYLVTEMVAGFMGSSLLHSGGAGGAGPFARRRICSLHGHRAAHGELAGAFNVFGVEGHQGHRKIDFALAFGHAGAGGFHLAARRTHHGPITLGLGVGKRVLVQIFFFHTGFIGVGVWRGHAIYFADHGYLPQTCFDVERLEGGRQVELSR